MAEFVNLRGMDSTIAALRALPAEISGRNGGPMRGALYAGTRDMRDEAVRLAPEDTGNLKKNIFIYRDRNPKASGANERYLIAVRTGSRSKRVKRAYRLGRLNQSLRRLTGTDAWYGMLQEFGTAKMPAKPFMRPAFEKMKAAVVSKFGTELGRGVDAATRRARARAGGGTR